MIIIAIAETFQNSEVKDYNVFHIYSATDGGGAEKILRSGDKAQPIIPDNKALDLDVHPHCGAPEGLRQILSPLQRCSALEAGLWKDGLDH